MEIKFNKKIFSFILFLSSSQTLFEYNGNQKNGFTFSILKQISLDMLSQFIYVCSSNDIEQDVNNYGSYSISICDLKNTATNRRFLPIITRNATINGVLEGNPLYGKSIEFFNLALGVTHEPKFYPLVVPANSSQVFLINNLDIYNNTKNFLIATSTLLDSEENPGVVNTLTSAQNQFLVSTLPQGAVFGNTTTAVFYPHLIQEKIIPIPGNSNYLTAVVLRPGTPFTINNETSYFLMNPSDNLITIMPNTNLISHGSQTINKFYIALSGSGASGINTVITPHGNLIDSSTLIDNNKIVATNQANTPLYTQNIDTLWNSTGLCYLIIQGGRNNLAAATNTIYALPLINYDEEGSASLGMLANVNQEPTDLFNSNPPYAFINNTFQQKPSTANDLYNWNTINAVVGRIPLVPYNKGISFEDTLANTTNYPFTIMDMSNYKDTVFVSAVYNPMNRAGVGGVFYSQAILNENGKIATWTLWQRKDIIGNTYTNTYIPTIGSNVAIYQGLPQSVVGAQISSNGPFASNNIIQNLSCSGSGIQKIVDIPFTHPGIGFNAINLNGLSPSYAIAVGYNTVILQQTAQSSGMFPILDIDYAVCENGSTISTKSNSNQTNMLQFQGGVLDESGPLCTAALGYTDNDCWIIAAGSNGIYILADNSGGGCGELLLQENFIGINANQVWQKLSNLKNIRKIVANKDFLYIITLRSVYRLSLTKENIQKKTAAAYTELFSINDLPNASEWSSFSDGLFSENKCIVATSLGLFVNAPGSSIKNTGKLSMNQIMLPENWNTAPVCLYPITISGYQDSWGVGDAQEVTGNIYVLSTSIPKHYSQIYRLTTYGNTTNPTNKETVILLPNYFIKNMPTYYYNPAIELLSIATDGASLFSHGVFGASYLYRSFLGIINPLLRHGLIGLRQEYNFFELTSKSNAYFGFPTYISGTGMWQFTSQNGIQGLC